MRLIEQNRHLSQHRSRLGDDGDNRIALDDLKPSLDQDIEVIGGLPLPDHDGADGQTSLNSPGTIIQNRVHPANTPSLGQENLGKKSSGKRLGKRVATVERI